MSEAAFVVEHMMYAVSWNDVYITKVESEEEAGEIARRINIAAESEGDET